jgi:hypothetical protein
VCCEDVSCARLPYCVRVGLTILSETLLAFFVPTVCLAYIWNGLLSIACLASRTCPRAHTTVGRSCLLTNHLHLHSEIFLFYFLFYYAINATVLPCCCCCCHSRMFHE